MKLKLLIGMVYLFGSVQMVSAVPKVKIIHVSGEVKIRRGVEEGPFCQAHQKYVWQC